MIDLANEEALQRYLREKAFVSDAEPWSWHYCGGGVSCTVVLVHSGERLIIVKQALEKLKVKEEWLCDPNRMYIEYRSNEIYHELVPACAPAVFFYDPENYIYARDAVPEEWWMWKAELLRGVLNYPAAEQAIRTLLTVHNECAKMPEVAAEFADKGIFYNLRVSPYIEFVTGRHPQLHEAAEEVIRLVMDNSVTLVHGDFSPKNIMTDGHTIQVLDYEVAHYGHPAFDLAFFSTHFILKSVKNRALAPAYLTMLRNMLRIYFDGVACMDSAQLERDYLRVLPFIVLARVDGKSPAEYITEEADKDTLREIGFRLVEARLERFEDMIRGIFDKLGGI